MNYLVHYKIIHIIRKIISTKAEIVICMVNIFMCQGIIHMNYLVHYKIIHITRKIISTKAEIIICMVKILFLE
jgi:hypothetical protein